MSSKNPTETGVRRADASKRSSCACQQETRRTSYPIRCRGNDSSDKDLPIERLENEQVELDCVVRQGQSRPAEVATGHARLARTLVPNSAIPPANLAVTALDNVPDGHAVSDVLENLVGVLLMEVRVDGDVRREVE